MQQSTLKQALDRATVFLLSNQDTDGMWRDYQTEIGRSDAWITAVVGLALVKNIGPTAQLRKSAESLLHLQRPHGWGYNGISACDADTTSWVIRFFANVNMINEIEVAKLLSRYIDPVSFKARTFSPVEKFGSWGGEHDEVTPLIGLALLAHTQNRIIPQLRESIISTIWNNFWWNCYSYASAYNLEFLSSSGGIPAEILEREKKKTAKQELSVSAFDLAHRISTEKFVGLSTQSINLLLNMQAFDGGWPASAELLVPDQISGLPGQALPDDKRLMTTASAMFCIMNEFDFSK